MKFPGPIVTPDGASTVTGTPATDPTSSTIGELTDHDTEESELPIDTPSQSNSHNALSGECVGESSDDLDAFSQDLLDAPTVTSGTVSPSSAVVNFSLDGGGKDTDANANEQQEFRNHLSSEGFDINDGNTYNDTSRTVEEEAQDNVRKIRSDIPYWRQQSGEYSRYLEEEKVRYEEEQRLWRKYKYMAFGTLAAFAAVLFAWRRYNAKT